MFKVGGMPCFKVKKKPSCKHWTSTGLQNDFTKDRNAVAKQDGYFYGGGYRMDIKSQMVFTSIHSPDTNRVLGSQGTVVAPFEEPPVSLVISIQRVILLLPV